MVVFVQSTAPHRTCLFTRCMTCLCVLQVKGLEAGKKELAELLMKAQEQAKAEGGSRVVRDDGWGVWFT